MYPSCSNFGLSSFKERSFLTAFAVTSDRLLRCGHEHSKYPLTLQKTGFKLLDLPGSNADFRGFEYSRSEYFFAYSDSIQDDSTLVFIKKLINNSFYNEALLEILRLEFQSSDFSLELYINKIICFKALDEAEKAIYDYDNFCPDSCKTNKEISFQMALIYYRLENYNKALELNNLAKMGYQNNYERNRSLNLEGLIYARKNEWEASYNTYKLLENFEPNGLYSKTEIALKAIDFKEKSAVLAGVLSIIPGAGYAYSGHYQTAISALFVNGLLAFATYSSLQKENYGMAALTGVFNLSFYIGNIYGAVNSAKRYNSSFRKSLINKLEYNTNF